MLPLLTIIRNILNHRVHYAIPKISSTSQWLQLCYSNHLMVASDAWGIREHIRTSLKCKILVASSNCTLMITSGLQVHVAVPHGISFWEQLHPVTTYAISLLCYAVLVGWLIGLWFPDTNGNKMVLKVLMKFLEPHMPIIIMI